MIKIITRGTLFHIYLLGDQRQATNLDGLWINLKLSIFLPAHGLPRFPETLTAGTELQVVWNQKFNGIV